MLTKKQEGKLVKHLNNNTITYNHKHNAVNIDYDDTVSGLGVNNIQDAIDTLTTMSGSVLQPAYIDVSPLAILEAPNTYPNSSPNNLIDNNNSTIWFLNGGGGNPNDYVIFDLINPTLVERLKITNTLTGHGCKDFEVYGSIDGVTYTLIESNSFALIKPSNLKTIVNTIAYRYYKIQVLNTHGSGASPGLAEVELLTLAAVPAVFNLLVDNIRMQKKVNIEQDNNIVDNTLLLLDMYEMNISNIETFDNRNFSLDNRVTKAYVKMINKGLKSIDDVPLHLVEEVQLFLQQ